MGKLFFVRKSQETMMREQTELLAQLLAAQQLANPQQQVSTHTIVERVTQAPAEQVSTPAESIPDFQFDEPDLPFIPRMDLKGKATLDAVSEETSDFDAKGGAKKLRKVKEGQGS